MAGVFAIERTLPRRHCERSEAIQTAAAWIASPSARNDGLSVAPFAHLLTSGQAGAVGGQAWATGMGARSLEKSPRDFDSCGVLSLTRLTSCTIRPVSTNPAISEQ